VGDGLLSMALPVPVMVQALKSLANFTYMVSTMHIGMIGSMPA